MPKRIPTPPPADDEPRYLSVVHPFVLDGHCNMELPKDRQDFARWVACCIDAKYFYAFFHKPKALDMVIIEVARDCPQLDRLLGEHRWNQFLRNPSEQDKDQVTKVFYCTYSSGRQVQKNGWKRIFVDDDWFKTWSPNNYLITFPYPETHFCDVPVGDQTNHPMCRPLPGAVKVPPPQLLSGPAPVVGSREWISNKQLPGPVPKRAGGAWAKGAPKTTAPVGNAWKAAIATSSPPIPGLKKSAAVGGGPITVKASDVWIGLPVPSTTGRSNGWADSPAGSGRNTPAHYTTPSPLPERSPRQTPDVPPGLGGRKAWNGGASSYLSHPPGVPVLSSESGTAPSLQRDNSAISWSSSGRSSSIGTDIILTPETAPEDPYKVHVQISDSMERELDALSIRDYDPEDEIVELDAIAPGYWDGPTSTQVSSDSYTTGNDGASWDDAPTDAQAQWTKNTQPEKPIICNAHGIICKKGICQEYAKQTRDAAREAERTKREETASNRKGRKGKGKGIGFIGGGGAIDRGGAAGNGFRGRGAIVKTNWRGTPRAIVSADVIEQRENVKDWESSAETPNAWGTASVTGLEPAGGPEASDEGWGNVKDTYDLWGPAPSQAKPQSKFQPKVQQSKPQPNSMAQAKTNANSSNKKFSSNWADEMDAHSAAGHAGGDGFSTVGNKRGGKTGKAAKSSTSGWSTLEEMPW